MNRILMMLCVVGCTGDSGSDTGSEGRATMVGSISWTLDFDATAEAAGHSDCTYTRNYNGVEDASVPWLCEDCDHVFRNTVALDEADCLAQISTYPQPPEEWFTLDDGNVYRSSTSNLVQISTNAVDGDTVTISFADGGNAVMGGAYTSTLAGGLELGQDDQAIDPPWEPSNTGSCGGSATDAPAYAGRYEMVANQVIPDGIFEDACGDRVRLHDFEGEYILLMAGWTDCPTCMNLETLSVESFLAGLSDDGISVKPIWLLSQGRAPALTPTDGEVQAWITDLSLGDRTVLADRKFMMSVLSPAIGDRIEAPATVVLGPDLTVLGFESGFSTLDDLAASIRSDAAR